MGKLIQKKILDQGSSTSDTGDWDYGEPTDGVIFVEVTNTATVDIEYSPDGGDTWFQDFQVSSDDVRLKTPLPSHVRANITSYTSGNVNVWVERQQPASG